MWFNTDSKQADLFHDKPYGYGGERCLGLREWHEARAGGEATRSEGLSARPAKPRPGVTSTEKCAVRFSSPALHPGIRAGGGRGAVSLRLLRENALCKPHGSFGSITPACTLRRNEPASDCLPLMKIKASAQPVRPQSGGLLLGLPDREHLQQVCGRHTCHMSTCFEQTGAEDVGIARSIANASSFLETEAEAEAK